MVTWELIIVILVSGFTLMAAVTVILANVAHLMDAKAKSRTAIMREEFKERLELTDSVLDKYFTRFERMIDKITGNKGN